MTARKQLVSAETVTQVVHEAETAHENRGKDSMVFGTFEKGLSILVEEVGEVAKEINDASSGCMPNGDNLMRELTQVAAMAVTLMEKVKLDYNKRS